VTAATIGHHVVETIGFRSGNVPTKPQKRSPFHVQLFSVLHVGWPAAVAAAAATAWLFRHTRTAPPLQQQRQPQRCSEQ